MSVQSQIDRIEQNVANTYAALSALGADMPSEQNSDNLPSTAGTAKAVLYSAQTLTEEQQSQARENIGAVSKEEISDFIVPFTVDMETGEATTEVNYEEIVKAYLDGKRIYAQVAGSMVLPLINLDDTAAIFSLIVFGTEVSLILWSDNTATFSDSGMAPLSVPIEMNDSGEYYTSVSDVEIMDAYQEGREIFATIEGGVIRVPLLICDEGYILFSMSMPENESSIHSTIVTMQAGELSVEYVSFSAGGAYYVTISETDGTLTADKTFAEIYEAYQNGQVIYAVVSHLGGSVLPLLAAMPEVVIAFGGASVGSVAQVLVLSNNEVTLQNKQIPDDDHINSMIDSKTSALTAADVGALPNTTVIPDSLSDLTDDSTHRLVTDVEKSAWNAKANMSDIPNVPTSLKNPNSLTINGQKYDGSVAVNMNLAKKTQGVFYVVGNSTTDGIWTGTSDEITEYFEGLTILYKTNVVGISDGTTLNINNLGAASVKRNASTAITTTYPVGSVIMFTYSTTDGVGCWLTADYDANTKTTAGTSNKTGTKLYLAGATSQSSSGATTYSNKNCYIGTDNRLYSAGAVVPNIDEINALITEQLGVIENGSY